MFDGEAIITEVVPENLRDYQLKGLSEDEAASSFNILFKMDNVAGEKFVVSLEVSPREGTGKAAGKKQTDMTYSTLVAQKIISSAGANASEAEKIERIAEAFAADVVGRKVNIYQKESSTKDQNGVPYLNTYFSNGPRRIPTQDVIARLAKLTGKPVAAAAKAEEDLPF